MAIKIDKERPSYLGLSALDSMGVPVVPIPKVETGIIGAWNKHAPPTTEGTAQLALDGAALTSAAAMVGVAHLHVGTWSLWLFQHGAEPVANFFTSHPEVLNIANVGLAVAGVGFLGIAARRAFKRVLPNNRPQE